MNDLAEKEAHEAEAIEAGRVLKTLLYRQELLIIDKDKNDVEVREAQYNLKYALAAQRMVQSDLAHYEKCIRIATLDLERLSKGPQ